MRLERYLSEQGIKDDVLLVFTSDNGTAGKKRRGGLRGDKGSHYDGGHNVPCLVRWKNGGIAGTPDTAREMTALTSVADFFPTFMDLCSLEKPDGGQPLHGLNISDLLTQPNYVPRERYLVVDTQRVDSLQKWRHTSILKDVVEDGTITHKWRVMRYKASANIELYDFLSDREQAHNIAPDHPSVIADLTAYYDSWWQKVSANSDAYAPFVLNSQHQAELTLTPQDWIGSALWQQSQVLKALGGSGKHAIRCDEPGQYEIELRRWPREDGGSIHGPSRILKRGKRLRPTQAKIHFSIDGEQSVPVSQDASQVTFTAEIASTEPQFLTSEFLDAKGKRVAPAYYVYLRKVK